MGVTGPSEIVRGHSLIIECSIPTEPPSEPIVPQLPILTYNDSPVFTKAEQLQVSTTANSPIEPLLLNTDNSSVVSHAMQLELPTPVDSLSELVQSDESEDVPLGVELQSPLPTDQSSEPGSGIRVSENSLLCQPVIEDNHIHFLKFDEELASISRIYRAHLGPIRNCQLFENSERPQVARAETTTSDLSGPATAPPLIGRCPSGVAKGTESPDQSSEPGSGTHLSENSLLCQRVKEENQVQVLKFDQELATISRGDRAQPRRSGYGSDSESDSSSSDNEAERRISARTISEHSLPAEIVSKHSPPPFKVKADKDRGEKDDLNLTKDLPDEEGKVCLYEKPDIVNHSSKSRSRSPNICGSMSPKRSPRKIPRLQSTSPVRQLAMQDHRTNSRSPALKAPEPSLSNHGQSLSRNKSPDRNLKRIRRGRGFTDQYSFARKFRTPSPEHSPPRSYHYRGINARDMNHYRNRSPNISGSMSPKRSPWKIPRLQSASHVRQSSMQDLRTNSRGPALKSPEPSLCNPRSFHYRGRNAQDMNHDRFGSYKNYSKRSLPSRYESPPRSFHYRGRIAQDMNRDMFRRYKENSKRSLPSRYQSPPRCRSPTRYRNRSLSRSISRSPTGYRGGHVRDRSPVVERRRLSEDKMKEVVIPSA